MLDDEVPSDTELQLRAQGDGRGMKAWQIADGDGGLRFEISKAGKGRGRRDGARAGQQEKELRSAEHGDKSGGDQLVAALRSGGRAGPGDGDGDGGG